jgi:hypothetical protein
MGDDQLVGMAVRLVANLVMQARVLAFEEPDHAAHVSAHAGGALQELEVRS